MKLVTENAMDRHMQILITKRLFPYTSLIDWFL